MLVGSLDVFIYVCVCSGEEALGAIGGEGEVFAGERGLIMLVEGF